MNAEMERACRKAAGIQKEKEQLLRELKQNTKEMMVLRDQVAIYKQEFRVLGKRHEVDRDQDALQLQEAVTNEIKRRRKPTTPTDLPITLNERRAHDRANIMKILKEYHGQLAHWDDILSSLV